jgi:hypothetical protein
MATEAKSPESVTQPSADPLRLTLAAGLLAGLAAWGLCEALVAPYKLPDHLIGKMGAGTEISRLTTAAAARRATITYTALGAALGLALGLAGGVARRSIAGGLTAALLGAAAGAGAGFGGSRAVMPYFHQFGVQITDNLAVPILLHGAIWSAVGAVGGLAFGLGCGNPKSVGRATLGGLIGALLGTVGYELVGALAFPGADTSRALANTGITRLLACTSVAFMTAAGAVLAVQTPLTRPRPAQPSA